MAAEDELVGSGAVLKFRSDMADLPGGAVVADRQLVARMATGDESALAQLYDRHARTAYAIAFAITRERADAEEAVADAFNQVWRNAAQYEADRGSVAAWLATMTRTRALDVLRARGRRLRALERAAHLDETGLATPVAAADAPDRAPERDEARRLVTSSLAELPLPQRRVVELAYFNGLTQSEIAAELQEPLGTVKTRMRAALEKLRARLGPLLPEGAP